MARYVLLVRHGSVSRNPLTPPSQHRLSPDGVREAYEVAAAFAETLASTDPFDTPVLGAVWYAPTRHANEMAGALVHTLASLHLLADVAAIRDEHQLHPELFRSSRGKGTTRLLARSATSQPLPTGTNAVLIVGHQPQLSWLCDELTGTPHPLARSEMLCIRAGRADSSNKRGQLLWSIAPTDNETMNQLREKIRSKMDVAKILGALILPLLAFPVGSLLDRTKMAALATNAKPGAYPLQALYLAAGLLLLGLILYLATVYAYDRLLMPTRFWSEVENARSLRWLVRRPPSSAPWILYQNMMRVWKYLFTPATGAVVAGVACLAYAAFQPAPLTWVLFWSATSVLVLRLYYRQVRPVLGAED